MCFLWNRWKGDICSHLLLLSSIFAWNDSGITMDPESSREWMLLSRTAMMLHVVWRFTIAQKFSNSVTAGSLELVESSRLVTCLCAGIQDDPHVKVMMAGSTLRKVKSRSWKKQRHFRLLEDGQTIWYKSRWAGRGHSTCERRTTVQTW